MRRLALAVVEGNEAAIREALRRAATNPRTVPSVLDLAAKLNGEIGQRAEHDAGVTIINLKTSVNMLALRASTSRPAIPAQPKVVKRLEAGAPVEHDRTMTVAAAFERYFRVKSRKRSLAEDRRLAEHLKAAFGKDTRVRDLTAGRIAAYRESRLAATSVRRKDAAGNPTPLSAASINRPLALLRHLLRLTHDEWEVLADVPRVKLEREPEGRIKWLEPDEESRLLTACADSDNPHLLSIVTLALETGMRHGETMGIPGSAST
jgi:hypothetical protein